MSRTSCRISSVISGCSGSGSRSAAISSLMRSAEVGMPASAFSCAWIAAPAKAPLPKTWSKCSWVLTTHRIAEAPGRPDDVVAQPMALGGAGSGVDHERPGRTDDDPDADVPLAVASHEAPVRDLDEALVPRRMACRECRTPYRSDGCPRQGKIGTQTARSARDEEADSARRPQARGAPGHRRGLRPDPGAGRVEGPGRATPARRLVGDRAQRHGRARGGRADRPAAHECRSDPHRQGLPALRRQPHRPQAADGGRAARHRRRSCRAPSTSTTWSIAASGCSPSSPTRWRSCSTRRCRGPRCDTSRSSR